MDTQVLVAFITGGFAVVVALLHRLQKENRHDHGIVGDSLNRIETKIDRHLDGHDR